MSALQRRSSPLQPSDYLLSEDIHLIADTHLLWVSAHNLSIKALQATVSVLHCILLFILTESSCFTAAESVLLHAMPLLPVGCQWRVITCLAISCFSLIMWVLFLLSLCQQETCLKWIFHFHTVQCTSDSHRIKSFMCSLSVRKLIGLTCICVAQQIRTTLPIVFQPFIERH